MNKGIIYGVGVGPGDPDLLSLKAYKLIKSAKYVAYFKKKNKDGISYSIIKKYLKKNVVTVPMPYPITTELPFLSPEYNSMLSKFYDDCCDKILSIISTKNDIIVLCEGDPFFYGSFMHIHSRLKNKNKIEVVPGITGMSAAWTATNIPITWGDDTLTIIMATLEEEEIVKRIKNSDAILFMKIGSNFEKIRKILIYLSLFEKAFLIENASMLNQNVKKLAEVPSKSLPYFSIIIVHGNGRRP